jgi:hypothetical protein
VPTLALFAHAVAELGDATLGARAEPLLSPYRDHWVVFGIGTATLGPVAYSLGLLQLLQDRPHDAVHTFESAVERSIRMRARPYTARSRAGLAESLRRRGQVGDAARAKELFALAATEARFQTDQMVQDLLAVLFTLKGMAGGKSAPSEVAGGLSAEVIAFLRDTVADPDYREGLRGLRLDEAHWGTLPTMLNGWQVCGLTIEQTVPRLLCINSERYVQED